MSQHLGQKFQCQAPETALPAGAQRGVVRHQRLPGLPGCGDGQGLLEEMRGAQPGGRALAAGQEGVEGSGRGTWN